MNDRQIDCFLEVARQLNFTRAAETLRLPQPAVSRYISSLENELGTVLITRERNRKISLTDAGKAYYNLFHHTALELARTKSLMNETAEVLHLGINIGWSTAGYLPKVVERCKQKNPKFRLVYECLDFQGLSAGLRKKRLDAVIGLESYLLRFSDFETERFTSLQRTVAYSRRLEGYENIKNPSDFYPYDFLIADDPLIRELVQESESIFRAFHFVPRFCALPNQETVHSYVENGRGVALLDEWCRVLHDPMFLQMAIEETVPVSLAWRKGAQTAAIELFRDALLCEFQNEER